VISIRGGSSSSRPRRFLRSSGSPEIARIEIKGFIDRMGLDLDIYGAYDRVPGQGRVGH